MTIEEIRARLAEIENELFARSAYASAAILSRPDPKALLAREQHFDSLRRERQSLHAQLPVTGERAGHLVMVGHFLRGTVIAREVPPEDPPDDGFDCTNPHQRFAKEMGWSLDLILSTTYNV